MDADLDIPALNRRAESFGLSVVHDDPEIMPTSEAGVPFRFNMGRGAYCRLWRDGEPLHKFSWRAEEVAFWLACRERERAA